MSELAVGSLKGLAANSFVIDVASGSKIVQPGSILQVVSTTKTDATFSTSSGTFTGVTGLTATITPTSTSSKILVFAYLSAMGTSSFAVRLARGGTGIALGDAAGSRRQATTTRQQGIDTNNSAGPTHITFVDSPSSTSALTYGVEISSLVGATIYVNRNTTDADTADYARGVSTITVMEVAG